MSVVLVESKNPCPVCKGHLWECCYIFNGKLEVENDDTVTPIVDGVVEAYITLYGDYVDFCAKCRTGITTSNW
jgi:hypothetical protein